MPTLQGPPNPKGEQRLCILRMMHSGSRVILTDVFHVGGYVNFDLCDNTGARAALLGDEVTGLGTATELESCPSSPETS